MATQNFTVTAASTHNEDFTNGTAGTSDQVLFIAYNSGVAVLTKLSASYGGSTDEIGITASTKYVLKLSADDTVRLANGATYTLAKVVAGAPTVLFSGTITVNSAVEDVTGTLNGSIVTAVRKTFTDDGDMGVVIPAGSICLKMIIDKAISNEAALTIKYKNANMQIIDENTIDAAGQYVMDVTDGITSEFDAHTPTAQTEDLSLTLSAWGTDEEITVIGVFVKVDYSA